MVSLYLLGSLFLIPTLKFGIDDFDIITSVHLVGDLGSNWNIDYTLCTPWLSRKMALGLAILRWKKRVQVRPK